MSGLPPKADIRPKGRHVRFGLPAQADVRASTSISDAMAGKTSLTVSRDYQAIHFPLNCGESDPC